MIYFHQNKGYFYEDEVFAKSIDENFIKNNKYQKAKLLTGNVKKTFAENIKLVGPDIQNNNSPLTPLYLFMDFHCGHFIGFVFHVMGRDHWRRESKILVFSIFAFGPILVFIYKYFRDMITPKTKKNALKANQKLN